MSTPDVRVVDHETQPPSREPKLVRDDTAYFLPMAIFLGFTFVGGTWPLLYVPSYIAKTIIVAAALVYLWRQYTPIRWNAWWLGVVVGIVGIFQWIGMQLWLQNSWPGLIDTLTFIPEGLRHGIANHFKPPEEVFDPTATFASPWTLYPWYAVRIIGAVLVVPVMEELFWRDWLWRTVIAPNDFKLARVGEWDWRAFAVVTLAFALVHGNWWLTSIVWAAMVGALLVYTRSLGACIIAHAVTNLLLAIYVLWTRDWSFW